MVYHKDLSEVDEKTSRINAAGLINSTLERLWLECYYFMSTGDYQKWNTKLDAVWAILGGDVEEDGDIEKGFNRINLKIYEKGTLSGKIGEGFNRKANPNNSIQYQWLLKKSLFLRRLQNKQGKGTAYHNEDDDDFD